MLEILTILLVYYAFYFEVSYRAFIFIGTALLIDVPTRVGGRRVERHKNMHSLLKKDHSSFVSNLFNF
jgi:hypothetical protein